MRLSSVRSLLFSSLFIAVVACGGKSSAPAGGGGGTGPTEPMPGPLAAGAWAGMNHEARAEFMAKAVLPTMAAEFKAFDADRFGDLDCATCHGAGAKDHTFKMPNPDIEPLSIEMIMNPDEDHKAITAFMMAKVKPGMAHLLGEVEYSPETPDGFGCFECHTMKQ